MMNSIPYFVIWLLTLTFSNASAFSQLFSRSERSFQRQPKSIVFQSSNLVLRGGGDDRPMAVEETVSSDIPTKTTPLSLSASVPTIAAMGSFLTTVGRIYTQQLDKFPILTKSYTAGLIFGLSDYIAQTIEKNPEDKKGSKINITRLITSALVGLLYFGPAAHYWYEIIFALLPGSSLWSTLQKAFWGQVIFGPSFTCIFFATSLIQSGQFSLKAWGQKIKSDLPGAWLAGAGFWPLVDLVSYSMIPVKWIPLFINMCSLVWTVYLSLIANRSQNKNKL